ncbi:50S ribosomal protein L22 [Candidatus Campbellbacteria bacterium]|nr:50S ribosomal protein L22 [Candidatus Campbellbacteria bacterium]|tara:strand:- start:207 stop:536 length:330 start_codon:yes stop_codon:yes gene_type:complete
MKATLKNYRQSPRKVRLVADLIRGKKVNQALVELEFLPKRATEVMTKLISSAAANAEHNFKVNQDELIIKDITVDKGITLKRYRPRARGVAKRINKRTSNIALSLEVKK